ncbi:type IV pilus modification PilV family protein [Rhodopirellula sp. JC639]|uniref:type IV pilus modification PilV family protein n=1 Tax=Stieleria mannarensis TaxID=2755585 RepID=UPI0016041404|nr:hypothetical protein [Rhodopirellula sp. JC639]
MRPTIPRHISMKRQGLSIMEVLFAIAVLTIGLLGVASILPVATNNAANALQIDRAIEEINNRVATDMARLRGSFTEVIVANNSFSEFNAPTGSFTNTNAFNAPPAARFKSISTAEFGSHLSQYDVNYPVDTGAPTNQARMPDAFCIDPWFLCATNNLRDDTNATNPNQLRNGYDRTVFPCFDPRYHCVGYSPSDALDSYIPVPGSAPSPAMWNLPRFTRLALPHDGNSGLLSAAGARALTLRSDEFSLFNPKDRTLGPGLFVQRSANAAHSLTRNTVSSRFSSIVLMSRSKPGSNLFDAAVVTMQDRQVVTVPGAGPALAHQLGPYTATDPTIVNGPPPPEDQLLYPGEQLGYVSVADGPFVGGGGGEFKFRTSRYVLPNLNDNDWLMLMRREYVTDPVTGAVVPQTLKFAWFQVSDVTGQPTVITDPNGVVCIETQVAVRGPDWVFHPIQVQPFAPASTTYAAPYYGAPSQPSWGTAPAFNYDNMMDTSASDPAGYKKQDFGTVVVIMPDVVSVKPFQVQL